MRFVLISTHIDQTTGYSKVSYNLLRQLASLSPLVKVFHYGFQRHPGKTGLRKTPDGVVVYDAAANEEPREDGFGFNKVREYLDMVNPDVVMIYNDPLVIARFLDSMKHDRATSPYKLWLYLDQVYEGIAPPLVETIRTHADRVYCFTDFWKSKLPVLSDVRVLGHAVDPLAFSALPPETRTTLRSGLGLPEDAIVFLNANRNSQRKRHDLSVSAFVKLQARYPDKPLYLLIATNAHPQSGAFYDIPRIHMDELARAGLSELTYASRLLLIDTSPMSNVLTDEAVNQLYNIADIGLNTSDGEGFGLCQLEHLYTGAPQVVTDSGNFRSILNPEVAAFVQPVDRAYFPGTMPLGFWAPVFQSEDVMKAMETVMTSLPSYKAAAKAFPFKSWAAVCDGFLEDILTLQVGDRTAIATVPVLS
jgi:glycosyltransferase involved in cell wall biosynthesis